MVSRQTDVGDSCDVNAAFKVIPDGGRSVVASGTLSPMMTSSMAVLKHLEEYGDKGALFTENDASFHDIMKLYRTSERCRDVDQTYIERAGGHVTSPDVVVDSHLPTSHFGVISPLAVTDYVECGGGNLELDSIAWDSETETCSTESGVNVGVADNGSSRHVTDNMMTIIEQANKPTNSLHFNIVNLLELSD